MVKLHVRLLIIQGRAAEPVERNGAMICGGGKVSCHLPDTIVTSWCNFGI
jgi:hypothetical protein